MSRRRRLPLATAPLLALAGVCSASPQYQIAHEWVIGGVSPWDYLSVGPGNRLFVTRADHIDVVNIESGQRIGTVGAMSWIHGVAFAPNLNRGFASDGDANEVVAFNLRDLKILARAPVSGYGPDAILYEPVTEHVFTFNGQSSNATVLAAKSLHVLATISLPGKPEFMATADARVFVNIETPNGQVAVIDAKANRVAAIWPLPGCSSPSGIALDAKHHRLFSVCENRTMAITDTKGGRHITNLAIGSGPDAAAFDPANGLAFSSNGRDGTLTVVHEDTPEKFRVVQTLPTRRYARTMALDPATHQLFLVTATLGPVPPPTRKDPHPWQKLAPNSFTVLAAVPQ